MFFLLTNLRPVVFNFADDSRLYSCRESIENIRENLEFELNLCLSGLKTIKWWLTLGNFSSFCWLKETAKK